MTIEWPSALPAANRDDYGFTPVSPMVRTEMQSGRARQRRRFTSVPTFVQVSWIMTAVQARYFESWFEGVLVSGSEWFDMPLTSPVGTVNETVRFVDIYSGPALVALDHWKFTAKIEVRDRPIFAGEWALYAPEFILYADLVDLAANREWPAA